MANHNFCVLLSFDWPDYSVMTLVLPAVTEPILAECKERGGNHANA
jgi:hypothetical protein